MRLCISRFILSETHRLMGSGAKPWDYIDDRYFCIPEAIELVVDAFVNNLVLQPSKI